MERRGCVILVLGNDVNTAVEDFVVDVGNGDGVVGEFNSVEAHLEAILVGLVMIEGQEVFPEDEVVGEVLVLRLLDINRLLEVGLLRLVVVVFLWALGSVSIRLVSLLLV